MKNKIVAGVIALVLVALCGLSASAAIRSRSKTVVVNRGNVRNVAAVRAVAVPHSAVLAVPSVAVLNVPAVASVPVVSNFRLNTFGTRTVVDGNGNVFEVDAVGNSILRGNRGGFNQFGGATVSGFGIVPVPVPAAVNSVRIHSFVR